MDRGRMVMFFWLVLSLGAVVGGWFLTKEMLYRREAELLGRVVTVYGISSELTAGEEELSEQETAGAPVFAELSEREIAGVLRIWEEGGREIPHEPEAGQMNMEQAIRAGCDWVEGLAEQGLLPPFLADWDFAKIDAKLYRPDVPEDTDASLLSIWRVTCTKEDVRLNLGIHAASGRVWRADLSMSADRLPEGNRAGEELLLQAFPFIAVDDRLIAEDRDKGVIFLQGLSGDIRMAVRRAQILVDGEEASDLLSLWLETER